jgi:hypothetical protein
MRLTTCVRVRERGRQCVTSYVRDLRAQLAVVG